MNTYDICWNESKQDMGKYQRAKYYQAYISF